MKTIVHNSYKNLEQIIQGIPSRFVYDGEYLHKGRNVVKRYRIDGQRIIVKKFKRPNIIQKIVYSFFKRSKAERAYLYAAKLRKLGIHTPHEIGYIEIKQNGLINDSYFISAECSYAALSQLLYDETPNTDAIKGLATFLVELHNKGILHGDLNLSNILYRVEEGGYEFTVIDTNRSKFKKDISRKECVENLKRLTHDRKLMESIIKEYASIRKWDTEEFTIEINRSLSQFENKIGRKRKLQKLLGLRK